MSTSNILASVAVLAVSGAVLAPSLDFGAPEGVVVSPPPLTEPAVTPDVHPISLKLDRTAVAGGRVEERFLQFEITMPDLGEVERRPLDLSVVIDNSGSMSGDRIDAARQAAHHLVDQLHPEDRFSLLTFDSSVDVLLDGVTGADRPGLHRAVDRIMPAGGTNLYAGLSAGVSAVQGDGRIPRVILLSDGITNEGITSPDAIATLAADAFRRGASTSTIGLGLGFNEDLMFAVSRAGGGSFDFVNDPSQLASVFSDELQRTSALAGRGAVVDLDLGEHVEGIEVLGWASTKTASGWTISLGDLPSGATRRVVARVRVTAPRGERLEVGTAKVRWIDMEEKTQTARATATVDITHSIAKAEASIDEEVDGQASWVYGNALARRSASAYAKGDAAAAEDMVEKSKMQLKRSASRGFTKAVRRTGEVERQARVQAAAAPSSADGRLNAKEVQALSALGYVE